MLLCLFEPTCVADTGGHSIDNNSNQTPLAECNSDDPEAQLPLASDGVSAKAYAAGILKHMLSASTPLLSLANIVSIAATNGIGPSAVTLVICACNLASIGSTGVTAYKDYQEGFKDFEEMEAHEMAWMAALSSFDIFSITQEAWGLTRSISGDFYDNSYRIGEIAKSAFGNNSWKNYGHALLGAASGIANAFGVDTIVRKTGINFDKLNQYLPEYLTPSQESKWKIAAALSALGTVAYSLYDAKHTTKASSYANAAKEHGTFLSLFKNATEAIVKASQDETTRSIKKHALTQTEKITTAVLASVVALAMAGRAAQFVSI